MITWTQGDVDTLKAAVASGILTVTYSGPPTRTIMYQNTKELSDELARINASVEAAAGRRRGFRLAATKKGL